MDKVPTTNPKHLKILQFELFIATVAKKTGQIELITIPDDINLKRIKLDVSFLSLNRSRLENNINMNIQSGNQAKATIIYKNVIIKNLTFDGYRVAGGSVVDSLMYSHLEHKRKYTNSSVRDYDIFPIVDVPANLNPHHRNTYLVNKANEIYYRFLNEIESLVEKYEEFKIKMICRNKDVTTISFIGPLVSIQFIHRVYTSEAELLAGFDLAASQCLYNGTNFKATRYGLFSIRTRIIPVDFTCASKSWAHRLDKYIMKGFGLWFPGLNTSIIIKSITDRKGKMRFPLPRIKPEDPVQFTIVDRPKMINLDRTYCAFKEAGFGLALDNIYNQPKTLDFYVLSKNHQAEVGFHIKTESDYNDVMDNVENDISLGLINFKLMMREHQINVGCNNIKSFMAGDYPMLDMTIPFNLAIKYPGKLTPSMFSFYFGRHALDASAAVV